MTFRPGSIVKEAKLDSKGRCCGRKPLRYKRPTERWFCPTCCREYDTDGLQRPNWAWKNNFDGTYTRQ